MLRGIKPYLIKQNLDEILKILQEKKSKFFWLACFLKKYLEKNIKINLIAYTLNSQKNFKYLFLPFLLDGVALKPELNLSDGKHPNSKGIYVNK